MTTDLVYLTWVTVLTGLIWVPYILDRIATRGLIDAVGYPDNPKPQSPWAARMMKAHANGVENLAIFAALVLVAHVAGVNNGLTATACAVYFWARVVHLLSYTIGVPWVRTLAFTVGFFAQAAIAWRILTA